MIIGVSGKIGAGKDTFAEHLMKIQPEKNWQVKKFAGKLKQIASILSGAHVDDFENPEFKKQFMGPEWDYKYHPTNDYGQALDVDLVSKMTYREFLQKLGTDAMRNGLHTNVWVNALFADYNKQLLYPHPPPAPGIIEYPNWIITDVRFPNEAQAVRDRGGILVRLHRNDDTGDHPSETALDNWKDWDFQIFNTGTIEDFRDVIELMFDREQ